MIVHLNTDNHITAAEWLTSQVEAEVTGTLERFGEQITRVEVQLHDLNGHKGGIDKRCLMEARLAGHQPIAVSCDAESLDEVIRGAAERLERALDHTLGRLSGHKGHTPMGGDPFD